ncbi:MAG: peptidoglycan DD-metalloendopeptidase family protein [Ardenticatenaceae bacterium]|nr:peptidoglycan DD-metalloendopeptidase family protein [Anaerolineales bacterium]MCB8920268.1 peptidoglycan DD-metalloendopeptidase family protein [Ardenticatenaceae bacterium]
MSNERTFLQRFGGQVILLVVVLLFWGSWRLNQPVVADETAVLTTTAVPFSTPSTQAAVTVTAVGDLPILSDNSLSPNPIPLTYQGQLPDQQFQTYVVERGDTPGGIAQKFGIEPETLLGGNPKLSEESNLLQTDVELIILPIDGVLHDVRPGDTLESLSEEYGIPVEDIIAYEPNNLEFPYRLYPETQIMIPGAVRDLFIWNPPDLSSVGGTSWEGRNIKPIIVGTGTFVYPVGSTNFTQYYWYGHPAIDIGLPEGSGVYASDTGTVTYAGWNNTGYGNLIVVNHGNGFETFYAHLSSINVTPGQIVYQGNLMGLSGNTGNSSGPHIHFEIRLNGNRDDPCWYLGC